MCINTFPLAELWHDTAGSPNGDDRGKGHFITADIVVYELRDCLSTNELALLDAPRLRLPKGLRIGPSSGWKDRQTWFR
jgi:hypothetical protein